MFDIARNEDSSIMKNKLVSKSQPKKSLHLKKQPTNTNWLVEKYRPMLKQTYKNPFVAAFSKPILNQINNPHFKSNLLCLNLLI